MQHNFFGIFTLKNCTGKLYRSNLEAISHSDDFVVMFHTFVKNMSKHVEDSIVIKAITIENHDVSIQLACA